MPTTPFCTCMPQTTCKRIWATGWTHKNIASAANGLLGAGAARTGPTNGDWGARKPDLAATSGRGEPQESIELVVKRRIGLLRNGPSAFSGYWRQRENPHLDDVGAALHATRIALGNLASLKVGRNSSRNPSKGNNREENGRETNEHVSVDSMQETMKELKFLLASDAHTHFLYIELPLLCPSWGRQVPWKGTGLNVQ